MSKIKILWFTNTVCGAFELLDKKTLYGGWLTSLENELKKSNEIELNVSFYYGENLNPLAGSNVNYFPVKRGFSNNKALRYLSRVFNINKDKIEIEKIKKIVDIVKPDIIHIHGTEDNFGFLNEHVLNIPIVISLQGIITVCKYKFFDGISKRDTYLKEPLINKLLFSSVKNMYKQFSKREISETQILKNAKNIIGRTNWDKRVSRVLAPKSSYYSSNEILRVSFYSNLFINTKYDNKINLVSIISSGHYKGLESLVKSFNILEQNTDLNITWKVIGLSKSDKYVKLVFDYLDLNLKRSKIEFVGKKSDKEILEIFNISDVYCQVSHIENSPNSLCEALISGIPVIASYAGGTSSLIEDQEDGLLFQSGDPYSLSGCILDVNKNYDAAISRSINAKKRANLRHNKDNITENLIHIYKNIINSHEI